MNLGFDLDNVISQTAQLAIDHLNETYDTKFTIDILRKYHIKDNVFSAYEDEQEKIKATLYEAYFTPALLGKAKPFPGAAKALRALKHQGHHVYIITARHKSLKDATAKWLAKNKIPYDELFLTSDDDKGYYARRLRLDSYVDDLTEEIEDIYRYRDRWTKTPMLMTAPWNSYEVLDPSKMTRVTDWNDILRNLSIANRFKA